MTSSTDVHTDVATQIADALGETAPEPRARAARVLGTERVQAFADQAQEIEQGEGILTAEGSRRRTLGGVFFYIMKAGIAREERWRVTREGAVRSSRAAIRSLRRRSSHSTTGAV